MTNPWALTLVRRLVDNATRQSKWRKPVKWTRLSCKSFRDNQVRLQLFARAYNLGNFWRLTLPNSVKHWSFTILLEKPIKIGAKIVKGSRYIRFQMAEVAVPGDFFSKILTRIDRLRLVPG